MCVWCVWGCEAEEWGCRKEVCTCLICMCVFVCVCEVRQGSGVAGRRNTHALSLGTRRAFLLNQKVCFLTFEMVDVASVHPPGAPGTTHCVLSVKCGGWTLAGGHSFKLVSGVVRSCV